MSENKRIYGKGSSELRRRAKIAAAHRDMNLEDWVTEAVEEKLTRENVDEKIRLMETSISPV